MFYSLNKASEKRVARVVADSSNSPRISVAVDYTVKSVRTCNGGAVSPK